MKIDTNIILHAIPAFVLLIIIEAIYLVKEHRFTNTKKDILANAGLGLGFVILSPVTKGINLIVYTLAYEHRIFDLPHNLWLAWILCFIADDFTFYWCHRMSHEVRFLWASHQVHHSGEFFSLSAAFRQSWTSNLTGGFLFWVWMPFVGFTPAIIMFMKSLTAIYQFWLHTETINKLPRWLEAIFNTPSHHRVHHGSDVEYLDKNHGGITIVWDKIFGTYREEIHTPKYGLSKNIGSYNPIVIFLFEWKNIFKDLRRSKNGREFINYLFNAPGWSSDGKSKTTKQLQRKPHKDCSSCTNTSCTKQMMLQLQSSPDTPIKSLLKNQL
jgi:sterol desaturase/sphingolipid hydroxylase (fatty acid hydroxylase superfamily)